MLTTWETRLLPKGGTFVGVEKTIEMIHLLETGGGFLVKSQSLEAQDIGDTVQGSPSDTKAANLS